MTDVNPEFVWWVGVVETRDDPLKLGRCKVRIFGWHTGNLEHVPTDRLPWAQPAIPTNNSLQTGAPQEGDYVFGFFFDGSNGQMPCIVGVFPGVPQVSPQTGWGFSDQRADVSSSPRKPVWAGGSRSEGTPKKNPSILGEPTTSRLARNEKIDETFISYRKNTLDESVECGVTTWSEPITEYNPVSPHNRVLETESGHILEFDDTPAAERIHLAHRSGTFTEVYPDGRKVTKIVNKNYTIIADDNNVHIKGACNVRVDGNANLSVVGNINAKVDGNIDATVQGNINLNNYGSIEATVSGDVDVIAGGNVNMNVGGDATLTVDGDVNSQASSFNLTGPVNITGDVNVQGLATVSVDVIGGGVSLKSHVHKKVRSGSDKSGPPD